MLYIHVSTVVLFRERVREKKTPVPRKVIGSAMLVD